MPGNFAECRQTKQAGRTQIETRFDIFSRVLCECAPAVGHLLAQLYAGEAPDVPLDIFAHRRFATGIVEPERNVV